MISSVRKPVSKRPPFRMTRTLFKNLRMMREPQLDTKAQKHGRRKDEDNFKTQIAEKWLTF